MSCIEAIEWAVVLTELLLPGAFCPGSDDPGKNVPSLRDWCRAAVLRRLWLSTTCAIAVVLKERPARSDARIRLFTDGAY